jgi:flagellum-specific ATP synthase
VSRLVRDLCSSQQLDLAAQAREALAIYRKNQDLINIGAYPAGTNTAIDGAIRLNDPLNRFLRQAVNEAAPAAGAWSMLGEAMAKPDLIKPRSVSAK